MKQCIECDRHLFGPEPECPFCGASQPTAGASLGPVAVLTLAFGLGLASCGPTITEDPSDTSGADSSGTTEPGATSAMTTVAMTSGTSTTTDGTTAASDDVDDSQDDAPCGFYAGCPPEDWGPIDFECDIFAQDCPPGEKCKPGSFTECFSDYPNWKNRRHSNRAAESGSDSQTEGNFISASNRISPPTKRRTPVSSLTAIMRRWLTGWKKPVTQSNTTLSIPPSAASTLTTPSATASNSPTA